ncbi:MAG: cytochrome c [Chthoniobacteraceae bacterium]
MLRFFFSALLIAGAVVLAFAGFRGSKSPVPPIEIFPDMDHQPKYQPQHASSFFADGSAARKPVAGTIPMGYNVPGAFLQATARNATFKPAGFTNQPDYFNTGTMGDSFGDGIPAEVTEQFVKRGQERFNIHCTVCHGKVGTGNGIVSNYGLVAVANLQVDPFKSMPDGQYFYTITNGKGNMGSYGPNIAVEDRWAIVAYIRALQRSQAGKLADLSAEQQKTLQETK